MSTQSKPDELAPDDPRALLPREIERLANQFFAQWPGQAAQSTSTPTSLASGVPGSVAQLSDPSLSAPLVGPAPAASAVMPPTRLGPSALNVGAGGASPAVSLPPTPGMLQSPPIANAPPPRESDLRNVVAMYAENVHGTSAVPLLTAAESGPSGIPYFLGLTSTQSPAAPYFLTPGSASPASALATLPTASSVGVAPPALPPGQLPSAGTGAAYPSPSLSHAAPSGLAAHGYSPTFGHAAPPAPRSFDANAVREDFPILRERIHGKRLVWLDNGATTQKPQSVIDRLSYFYEHENSNIHRGAHTLAARSTDAYEGAREKVARFLNAESAKQIVFTRGTTESINLVAQSWGRRYINPGDEIVLTWLEHHANIVPWQMVAAEKGARLRIVPVDDSGQVILSEYEKLLGPRTRFVSISHVSNALGTIVPVAEMVQMAHRYGATTLVDGAQAVSHMRVDVRSIDSDFYVFSGHKVFAPTGIGALYGKSEALELLPPWQGGGNMIQDVTFDKTLYAPVPGRFEAGTGNIADAVGLGAAIDYVESIGIENVGQHEHSLLQYGTAKLREIPGLRMIGTAAEKAGVMSFVIEGLKTEELGAALDREGIAVRAGHHCAQPILRRFGVESTVRASLAPYNTREDIDVLVAALSRLASNRAR